MSIGALQASSPWPIQTDWAGQIHSCIQPFGAEGDGRSAWGGGARRYNSGPSVECDPMIHPEFGFLSLSYPSSASNFFASSGVSTPIVASSVFSMAIAKPASKARSCSSFSICSKRPGGSATNSSKKSAR